jgi:hypothetical protein
MPYVCGKCYKTKSGAGGRKHRSHGSKRTAGGKKKRTPYQSCMSKAMKHIKAPSFEQKVHMANNQCGRLVKRKK